MDKDKNFLAMQQKRVSPYLRGVLGSMAKAKPTGGTGRATIPQRRKVMGQPRPTLWGLLASTSLRG